MKMAKGEFFCHIADAVWHPPEPVRIESNDTGNHVMRLMIRCDGWRYWVYYIDTLDRLNKGFLALERGSRINLMGRFHPRPRHKGKARIAGTINASTLEIE